MILNRSAFFKLFGSGEAPGVDEGEYAAPGDRRILVALARVFRPRVVVELGVQRGQTALALLRCCPWIEQYVGVDVECGFRTALAQQQAEVPAAGEAGALVARDPRFRLVLRPGGTQDLVPADLPVADLVYIDADHSEAGVARDTALARAVVRPGGVVAWHDYISQAGVRRVVDDLNRAEGDQIALVDGSWVCFELRGARSDA